MYLPQTPNGTSSRPTSRPLTHSQTAQSTHSRSGGASGSRSGGADDHEGQWVVAIIEGKGMNKEIGLVSYNQITGIVALTQLSDSPSFAKTFHQLSLHPPSIILVTDTALPTPDTLAVHRRGGPVKGPTLLVQSLVDGFPDVDVVPVPRKYWSDEAGHDFLEQLLFQDEDRSAVVTASESKYLALCATSALFKYLEMNMSLSFAPKSLSIKWDALDGTMYIDPETAVDLELIRNRQNPQSTTSLFGVLNQTFTPMAARMLRANLLQPIIVQTILNKRLDVVEELLSSEDLFLRIKTALQPLHKIDIDKLINQLAQQDPKTDPRRAERGVSQILQLRTVVRSIAAVRDALEGVQCDLLLRIQRILKDDRLGRMDAVIQETLEEDTGVGGKAKKGGLAMRNAKIYAVKANRSPLLDVARETYKENISDILVLVKSYQDEFQLPSLNVTFQDAGLNVSLSTDDIGPDGLPSIFVNVEKKGNKLMCQTLELKKRQQRYVDTLTEIFLMSDQIIQDLLAEIVVDIGVLYKTSEAIAMLDLFWSFAQVASSNHYVRPEYVETLAVKGGRHPILDRSRGPHGSMVPNDYYASETSAFQIIQGPNMSGKTTYITSIGLMTVQALIGSYVPAEYASFKLNDCLLSRLSNNDDMAGSLSTFALEMRTSSSILSLVTKDSLVLIDELGRGTSPNEGTAIAHAISEALIETKATVFFATHFRDLSLTLAGFPSVQNLHLQIETHHHQPMQFNYKVLGGTSTEDHYGLSLAQTATLPPDILIVATDISSKLCALEREGREASKTNTIAARRKALLTLREKIKHATKSTLPGKELLVYLRFLQREALRELTGG